MKFNSFKKRKKLAGFAFVIPSLLILGIFFVYPVYKAFFISFTKYDIINSPEWIGLKNYKFIFNSRSFLNSLKITLKYVIASTLPIIILSLLLAVRLNKKSRFSRIVKTLIFIPHVISEAIIAIIWLFIFNPYGVMNELLIKISFMDNYIKWLADSEYVILAFIILTIWKNLGYFTIIFSTGLANIPKECFEAAAIDGCTGFKSLIYIILPLLKSTLIFASIIALINTLNTFTPFYIMTNGGPNNSSEVLSLLIYNTAFKFLNMGKASAMCIIILLIVLVLSSILLYFGRSN